MLKKLFARFVLWLIRPALEAGIEAGREQRAAFYARAVAAGMAVNRPVLPEEPSPVCVSASDLEARESRQFSESEVPKPITISDHNPPRGAVNSLKPTCAVMIGDRRFDGSSELYLYAETPHQEFWLSLCCHMHEAPLGYLRFVRCGEEVISQKMQGLFELREVRPGDSPAPSPIVSLSGVLSTRRVALEADRAICAYQMQGGQSLES